MEQGLIRRTMGYHRGGLANRQIDYNEVMYASIAKGVKAYKDTHESNKQSPEIEAMRFYLAQHILSDLQKKYGNHSIMSVEDTELTQRLNKLVLDCGTRMFAYLVMICTRELRHTSSSSVVADAESILGLGPATVSYYKSIVNGGGESGALATLFSYSNIECDAIRSTKAMAYIFNNGSYPGGFGGPAWGKVAECLANFVDGTYTLEMMTDLGFALAHNNGPIFNKGMVYNNYGSEFLYLLDIQRSGQIPHMLAKQYDCHQSIKDISEGYKLFSELKQYSFVKDNYCDLVYSGEEVMKVGVSYKKSSKNKSITDKVGIGSKPGQHVQISAAGDKVLIIKREEV